MTKLRLIAMQEEHKYKISQGRNEIFKKVNNSVPQNNADILSGSLLSNVVNQPVEQVSQSVDMEEQAVNLNSPSGVVNNEVTNAIFGTSIDDTINPTGVFENPILPDVKTEETKVSQLDSSNNGGLGETVLNVPFNEPVIGSSEKSTEMSDDAFISLMNSIRNEIDLKLDSLRNDFHKGLDRLQEDFLQKSGASLVTSEKNDSQNSILNNNPENFMAVPTGIEGMNGGFDPQATMVVPIAEINSAREMTESSGYKNVA